MDGFLVEAKRIRGFSRSFRTHFHEEYSIALVREGRSRAEFPSGPREVSGGCLVLIPARVPHACNPDTAGAWTYLLLLTDPAWISGISPEAEIRDFLFTEDHRILPAPPDAGAAMEEAARSAGLPDGSGRSEAAEGLKALLLAAADGASREEAGPEALQKRTDPRARRIESLLRTRLDGAVTLRELSAEAGVGEREVLRLFRAAYGISPYDYRTNLRINEAKRLLRSGVGISDAVQRVGFFDQSHLHRHFVRRVGLTPAAYAARVGIVQDDHPRIR